MQILKIELKNFGRFLDHTLEFHDGLNILCAKNSAGKSTIHTFLGAMLYGLNSEECVRYQAWNGNGCLSGKLWFETRGKRYRLERDFLAGKHKGRLFCETEGHELPMEELSGLFGNMSEEAYRNTFFICQKGAAIQEDLTLELRDYLSNLSGETYEGVEIRKAMELKKERLNQLDEEKKKAQLDLISQQQEIRMKMDYVEEDLDRLKKEQDEMEENRWRLLKFAEDIREDKEFRRRQAEERDRKQHAREMIGLCLMLGAVFMALAGIYVPSLLAKAVLFFAAFILGISDFLYQRNRAKILESEAKLAAAREAAKEEAVRKKAAEIERMNWQLEKLKESIQDRQGDYQSLKDSMRELRGTDHRLDSLDAEIQKVHQEMRDIEKRTRAACKKASGRLDRYMNEVLEKLTDPVPGTLLLNERQEVCLETPKKLVKLSEESYGSLDQAKFAARIALGKALGNQEPMPILLDDTFAAYDQERLTAALRWLKKCGHQVILFTSRSTEGRK